MSRRDSAESDHSSELTWLDFLLECPPGEMRVLRDVVARETRDKNRAHWVQAPDLLLHCPNEDCEGLRYYGCANIHELPRIRFSYREDESEILEWHSFWMEYICRNCLRTRKTFAIRVRRSPGQDMDADALELEVVKVGELPPFAAPRVHPRVARLLGDEWGLFVKGRRSENEGLGIGALAYYRRVVTGKWQRLLEQIVKAAGHLETPSGVIDQLKAAQAEQRFSRAVELIKQAIPTALLIRGQNPLTLLHNATSVGLHDLTDDQCLELAGDIRTVLTELAERIDRAMKNRAVLHAAVDRLQKAGQEESKGESQSTAPETDTGA